MRSPPSVHLLSRLCLAPAFGVFLLVLGLRLTVVDLCGVPVPYVDEWSAIGRNLLLPLQQGTLDWSTLWTAHNGEHRIVATRLLELLLFAGNGQWDPLVGMTVNAFLMAAAVALWVSAAGKPDARIVLGLALLWALPFGYANLLWPFQSHVFLLLFGTVLALREASGLAGGARVRGWVVALGLAVAVLSSSGGLISAIVAGAVVLARVAARSLSMRAAAAALVAIGTAAGSAWWLAAARLAPPAWDAALLTLLKGASWPLSNLVLLLSGSAASARYLPSWLPIGNALAAIGQNADILLAMLGILSAIAWAPFFSRTLALRRGVAHLKPRDIFHFGLATWVLATLAAIALKRATDYFVPTRYIDLLLPGIAVNGWFALQAGGRWQRRIWLAVVGGGLFVTIAGVTVTQLPRRAAEGEAWLRHLSGYAQHRDVTRLENLEVGHLPNLSTDPGPLVAILDLPGFSAMLVPELRAEPPHHGPLGRAARVLLSGAPILAIGGLLLLLGGWWRGGKGETLPARPSSAAVSPECPSPPGPPSR
jgi:hypothetical protein